ncbi:hypothetical protein T439DRAFT_377541 [Meredithblackwellia eburnea MCA 4105]
MDWSYPMHPMQDTDDSAYPDPNGMMKATPTQPVVPPPSPPKARLRRGSSVTRNPKGPKDTRPVQPKPKAPPKDTGPAQPKPKAPPRAPSTNAVDPPAGSVADAQAPHQDQYPFSHDQSIQNKHLQNMDPRLFNHAANGSDAVLSPRRNGSIGEDGTFAIPRGNQVSWIQQQPLLPPQGVGLDGSHVHPQHGHESTAETSPMPTKHRRRRFTRGPNEKPLDHEKAAQSRRDTRNMSDYANMLVYQQVRKELRDKSVTTKQGWTDLQAAQNEFSTVGGQEKFESQVDRVKRMFQHCKTVYMFQLSDKGRQLMNKFLAEDKELGGNTKVARSRRLKYYDMLISDPENFVSNVDSLGGGANYDSVFIRFFRLYKTDNDYLKTFSEEKSIFAEWDEEVAKRERKSKTFAQVESLARRNKYFPGRRLARATHLQVFNW